MKDYESYGSPILLILKEMDEYCFYERKLFQNYGRNQFVQKNEVNNGIAYSFKFRGKEVCITLENRPESKLHLNGNGSTQWRNEALSILRQQYRVNYF